MNTGMVGLVSVLLVVLSPALFSAEKPKLVLEAPRLQMISPGLAARGFGKRVNIRGRLEGDLEDPKQYYCLDEIWDWGDGTESVHEPDCDPYEKDTELNRDFYETHHFGPGRWFITLALMDDDDVVIDGTVEIRIY